MDSQHEAPFLFGGKVSSSAQSFKLHSNNIMCNPLFSKFSTICFLRCLRHEEPVLLVGETGCGKITDFFQNFFVFSALYLIFSFSGKTTICQIFSILLKQKLHVINCHQVTFHPIVVPIRSCLFNNKEALLMAFFYFIFFILYSEYRCQHTETSDFLGGLRPVRNKQPYV